MKIDLTIEIITTTYYTLPVMRWLRGYILLPLFRLVVEFLGAVLVAAVLTLAEDFADVAFEVLVALAGALAAFVT
ncbi:MAG: hypothetical protein WAZ77_00170 [Candidatus Nitrosopolaris sp.]|jgi:hypothetical protein